MSEKIQFCNETITVDNNGDSMAIRRTAGRIRNIYLFGNGMIAATDGVQQIPSVQGPLHELLEELLSLKERP